MFYSYSPYVAYPLKSCVTCSIIKGDVLCFPLYSSYLAYPLKSCVTVKVMLCFFFYTQNYFGKTFLILFLCISLWRDIFHSVSGGVICTGAWRPEHKQTNKQLTNRLFLNSMTAHSFLLMNLWAHVLCQNMDVRDWDFYWNLCRIF